MIKAIDNIIKKFSKARGIFYTPAFTKMDGQKLSQGELFNILEDMFVKKLTSGKIKKKYNLSDDFSFNNFPKYDTGKKCKYCKGKMVGEVLKDTRDNFSGSSIDDYYKKIKCIKCDHTISHDCACNFCKISKSIDIENLEKKDFFSIINNFRFNGPVKFSSSAEASKFVVALLSVLERDKNPNYLFSFGEHFRVQDIHKFIKRYFDLSDSIEIKFISEALSHNKIVVDFQILKNNFLIYSGDIFSHSCFDAKNIESIFKEHFFFHAHSLNGKSYHLPKELLSNDAQEVIDYMLSAMDDFEFDNYVPSSTMSANDAYKNVFKRIEKHMGESKTKVSVLPILNPIHFTMEFFSEELFVGSPDKTFSPYKNRVAKSNLLERVHFSETLATRLIDKKYNPEGFTSCAICHESNCDLICIGTQYYCIEHIPKKNANKYKKLMEIEKRERKIRLQRKEEIEKGIRFKCSCCKKAVLKKYESKKKNICKGCAKYLYDIKEVERLQKARRTEKEILKKKLEMSNEEKALAAKKDQDMITAFLAKKQQ